MGNPPPEASAKPGLRATSLLQRSQHWGDGSEKLAFPVSVWPLIATRGSGACPVAPVPHSWGDAANAGQDALMGKDAFGPASHPHVGVDLLLMRHCWIIFQGNDTDDNSHLFQI